MKPFDPEEDRRLMILNALECGHITAEDADRRLNPPKKPRGRPAKIPSPLDDADVYVRDSVTGKIFRFGEAITESDFGTEEHRKIGGRYVQLRRQHSQRIAMSKMQRELLTADPDADSSEGLILKCRRRYLLWLSYRHLI